MPRTNNDDLILRWASEKPADLARRLDGRLDAEDGHELWTGARTRGGYGVVALPASVRPNTLVYVHRVAWVLANGPIPDGMVVDHDATGCRTRHCVRLDHLTLERDGVTGVVHRTHCRNCGSPRTLYGGTLRCRPCRLRTNRERTTSMSPMPYKGTRMRAYTRVHPDILADAQRLADHRKMGLSDWIAEAMEQKVKRDKTTRAKAGVAA